MNSVLFESIFTEQLYNSAYTATVIISNPWSAVGADERALLSKILSAVRLTIDSVIIKHQVNFDLSEMKINSSKVIYFGNAVNGLPIYENINANGLSIVMSQNLTELLTNDDAKKRLWLALKKQFSV